ILHALSEAAAEYRADVNALQRAKKCLEEVLNDPAAPSDLKTTAVGHAHIDTGWLWPVDETVRKCARTFARQISLMEDYPDYVFGASQAQHYAFVKEHYPGLYEKICQKVEEGRWEPQGGMWVEADCNVIGGESMVRQMLHGKNFFRDEFGVDVENLWLPDVFGYSAALPQILKKSGIDSLVTQKISWSQYNKFPHHTFVWEGIDGSEVVAHFPPEDNYNSTLNPGRLAYARDNFTEKGFLDEFLTLYGLGDGGGGPTEDIIEAGRRQKNLEGSPKVEFGPAQPFLDRLCDEKDRLERWVGELYLELHRGTLTTQAHNKKMNRAMELRLREIEWIYSCLPAENYPREELDSVWKRVLMNQFHDILPGSSIRRVYQDTRGDYESMWEDTERLAEEAGQRLFEPDPESVTLVNTLSEPYRRPVELPAEWSGCEVLDAHGNSLTAQSGKTGPIVSVEVPESAALTLKKGEKSNHETEDRDAEPLVLENELVRYEFAEDGTLSRAFDKKCERETIPDGESGNKLQLYRDRPVAWDAWDVDIFYEEELLEQAELTDWERWPGGAVQETLHLEFAIGDSTIEQDIVLAVGSKQLEFRTSVDWREDHRMLRVSFPVAVFAQEASFEIQYGHVRRNTHRNTSWDMAKFESCAHRFVDLSEHDYGVALLNDCKYGHKVLGHVLDLNLLRSPTHPDPDADRGCHEFTYSLLPHTGNLAESCVFAEAAQLNQPVMVYDGMRVDDLAVPCRLDGEGVALEVLKRGEKEECHIVRLYEQRGRRSRVALSLREGISEISETNLMEDSGEVLDCDGQRLELQFEPFEIRTLKLR
ncbi:MAG: alpha-mannosidase, partial [Planctomycetes bacterium]|nr:alpha-mannosidase [Planctomycetota bacterium]